MLTYNVYFKPVFIITYFTKIVNKFLIEFVPILYIFRHFVCHIARKHQIQLHLVFFSVSAFPPMRKNTALPLEYAGKIQYNGNIRNLFENSQTKYLFHFETI